MITGITGQDGAYLSQLLIAKNYKVVGINRSYNPNTFKLDYLGLTDNIQFEVCDLMDSGNVSDLIEKYKPNEIYNLAAQSSVGMSFEQPTSTLTFNILSVINQLETIKRLSLNTRFYQASTSEMFGNVANLPIRETETFHPASPYAISKASAHWIVTNYRESYGIFACSGILFNHESFLRDSSFFVKKIISNAVDMKFRGERILQVGDLSVKRDFGYSPDYVKAMWLMLQQDMPDDYIICSGESITLQEIVRYVFLSLKLDTDLVESNCDFSRPNELMNIYGDNSKAKSKLGWSYDRNVHQLIDLLIEEEKSNYRND